MNVILLEESEVFEYVEGSVSSAIIDKVSIHGAKYHHNSSYADASLICKHGILTIQDLVGQNLKKFSDEQIDLLRDYTSHANSVDSVSLAVMGLTNLYSYEEEYDPYTPYQVDFLVSNDVKAFRYAINYGNEYISNGSINKEMLKAIDVRFLKYVEYARKSNNPNILRDVVKKYNSLRELAFTIRKEGLLIPLREMSYGREEALDIYALSKKPNIILNNR